MTPEEIVDLLTLAASFDRRTVGKADVAAWRLAVADLPFEDAQAAVVKHYRDSRDFLMPADVRRLVTAAREARISARPLEAPPAPTGREHEGEYRRALKEITRRAGDGLTPFKAIPRGKGTEPPEEFKQARTADDRDRVLAQTIPCPTEWCNALTGEPCRSGPNEPPMTKWHPSRLAKALELDGSEAL